MVRAGNPIKRAKEYCNSNINLSFDALKVVIYAKMYKNCPNTFF